MAVSSVDDTYFYHNSAVAARSFTSIGLVCPTWRIYILKGKFAWCDTEKFE